MGKIGEYFDIVLEKIIYGIPRSFQHCVRQQEGSSMAERKLRVEDYMVRDVIEIPGGYTVAQTTAKLISTEFHGLPVTEGGHLIGCLLYTSPSPRDGLLSRMPSSA